MPTVSVIVPVYKVERYIRKCIDSILKQSFTDFELILVDDGSPDKCGEICDEYAAKDKRIKVIHKKNGGLSDARNAGLDYATGGYICFIDSDDWIHKDLLKDNLERLVSENADVIIFNYVEVFKETSVERLVVKTDNGEKYDRLYYFSQAPVMVWCKLYRAHIWKKLRFPVGLKHEDDYTMPYVVTSANKIVTNEKAYYYYNRTNDNSIMAGLDETHRYTYFLCGLQKLKATEGKEQQLYESALKTAFSQALKAYNSNTLLQFLTPEQLEEVEQFLHKYRDESGILSTELKIYLWGYFHCQLINKAKGLYYLRKYKGKRK